MARCTDYWTEVSTDNSRTIVFEVQNLPNLPNLRIMQWDFQITNGTDIFSAVANLWVGYSQIAAQVALNFPSQIPAVTDLKRRLCLRNLLSVSQWSLESDSHGYVLPQPTVWRPTFTIVQPGALTFQWRVGLVLEYDT